MTYVIWSVKNIDLLHNFEWGWWFFGSFFTAKKLFSYCYFKKEYFIIPFMRGLRFAEDE